jgi:hypothetical protein
MAIRVFMVKAGREKGGMKNRRFTLADESSNKKWMPPRNNLSCPVLIDGGVDTV